MKTKREINNEIVTEICRRICTSGITNLKVFPVENTCTYRPLYWKEGDKCLFKILMWDINKLEGTDLSNEIDKRILSAKNHFGL